MTLPLDPQIPALMTQMTKRTTCVIDLATPTPRRYTNYPGGITVASVLGTLTLTAGGSGFTSAPLVTFSSGGGQSADAIAIISGGVVTSLIIMSRGWGYTSNPTVTISGGGGSGATATATIGVTFAYADITFSPVAESADGSSVITASLTIGNAEHIADDLVLNAANVGVPIAVQKVWRNTSEVVVASEIWFEGYTGRPAFAGEYVTLDCAADTGRRGESPMTEWSEALIAHQLPDDSTKSPFMTPS